MDKIVEAMSKFKEAAECFLAAHVHPEKETERKLNLFAAKLFQRCREFVKAGEIYFGEGDYVKAGDCFKAAKKYENASEAYFNAGILIVSSF